MAVNEPAVELVVIGGAGKLGKSILDAALAHSSQHFVLSSVTRAPLNRAFVNDFRTLAESLKALEPHAPRRVVVDASTAGHTQAHLAACVSAGAAYLCATTGLHDEDQRAIDAASRQIAVMHAANLSVSAHVAALLAAEAARLWPLADVEIVETHHRHKKDAPSGTALMLAGAVQDARGAGALKRGRDGVAPRAQGEIGISAVRGGDVVGEHTVHFLGDGERIELVHRVSDRAIFGRGAVRAALFLAEKGAGRFTMRDVLAAHP